jgi:transcriptional regulator with XRE-family HTH domain
MADNDFQKKVGQNIRNHRKALNMTMKELGAKVGLTESSISKYESGDIQQLGIDLLKRMAIALSCKPEELTGWEEPSLNPKEMEDRAIKLARHNKLYEQLSPENQKTIDNQIEFMIHQQSHNTRKDSDKAK